MQLLTSESVTPGHPDKLCDQISDAILDAHLEHDKTARVAIETMATAHAIIVAGEVRSTSNVDVGAIVRRTIREIGYTAETGLDPDTLPVVNHLTQQSSEIGSAVDGRKQLGAGDQGMMFGYATTETEQLMPAPITLARALTTALAEARATLPWLRPDGKAQVTVKYEDGTPRTIDTIVLSVQHDPSATERDLNQTLLSLARETTAQFGFPITNNTTLHLNPAGAWTFGGPAADSGLTGRKIIADTYGGAARHGGGAFSGKDPSKVDRSAAYAARHAAKHIVAHGWATRAEVQLSYAIGIPDPVSVSVETFGTHTRPVRDIEKAVTLGFDFTPQGIIDRLKLANPIYLDTARHGHFGRSHLPWETIEVA